jgi:hypothetical protein
MTDEEAIIQDVINREATRVAQGEPQQIPMDALGSQVGGDHYVHMSIQPIYFSMLNGLNACQHSAIKYIVRRKSGATADRLADIDKAIHTLQIYRDMIGRGEAL